MNKLLVLLLITSCAFHTLKVSVVPSHFYESNKQNIDATVSLFKDFCRPEKEIYLNLKFDYLSQELININPNQIGQTSFFSDSTWIDTNIFKFAYLNDKDRFLYLLHETGHAVGLEHVEEMDQVMSGTHNSNADLGNFKLVLKKHCSQIKDVPREPKFF